MFCGLFNNVIINSGYYLASDYSMTSNNESKKMWISMTDFIYYPHICLKGVDKNLKKPQVG